MTTIAPAPPVRPLAGRWRRRVLVLLALLAALVLATLLSLTIGAKPVPLGDTWHALTGPTGTENDIVIRSLRVPRTILGVLAGIALGCAGALMQGHTRNPLADPGLLGVTQGAAFAMVASIVLLGIGDLYGYIWFGLAGALLASVGVFALGTLGGRGTARGGPTPVTLALAGTAVSAFLYALTSTIVLLDEQAMDTFRFWQAGSIAGRPTAVIGQVLPFLITGLVLALANAPGLNALSLGEDVARALGQNVARTRAVGVAAITLLTGASVAACGAVAFVGLMVPHLVRPLAGPDHRWLLPYSGLAGAALLLFADVLGRVVARPGELEVGVVLALLGAPFFVALVRRRKPVRL
ncbi:iron complex transport system permease protein [Thermocatellispora tengchongensis]|uniref:Iron complex transport system permease protein n=1 Tax=Thermocatellispora tengchongensis TaxID=1073253 RepID=A0A840P5K3_9ACTN|nr:iron ABC transporter permease [Thermocatellispora tengchongensis]MBB5132497.1 iron complex transport system permease protein [Thermocatellispora tengchongensis]